MILEVEVILRLLLAGALGALIGFQRQRAQKPAGMRTLILISVGSALFTIVSVYGFSSGAVDPARVAAQIVTGIGFLGAGVILHGIRGNIIMGLTTAASIWVTAAIGMAAGTGLYLISITTAVIVFFVLLIPSS